MLLNWDEYQSVQKNLFQSLPVVLGVFWLRQELCVNEKAHSVDQVKTLILMYLVFL